MFEKLPRAVLEDNNIFNAPEQTIIVTTNIVGAMGKGLALECKQRYPHVYKHYRDLFESGGMFPNTLSVVGIGEDKNILLFPTKIHWRNASPPALIIDNLKKMADNYQTLRIESLAIPPLGMRNGWLKPHERQWVMHHIESICEKLPIKCVFYHE